MEQNKNLLSALKLEKLVMFIILALIILVASFNIISALVMTVMEKKKDIAILKAMGATNRSIMRVFVAEGLTIGVFGALLGTLVGYGLLEVQTHFEVIKLPSDVYYISTLPMKIDHLDVVLIAAVTILLCLLSTLYPSYKASTIDPWRRCDMSDPLVSVRGLKRSFHRDGATVSVLKGIDFEVAEGEFATIMGPSGAGKTTFLHVIGSLDRPTEGEVFYQGKEHSLFTGDEQCRFRNEKVGFVFQFYHLLQDFTVLENIMVPLWIRRVKASEAQAAAEEFLQIMGLADRRHHKTGRGVGRRAAKGGCRTGPHQPARARILADEPTGNLDRKTGRVVPSVSQAHDPQEFLRRGLGLGRPHPPDPEGDHDILEDGEVLEEVVELEDEAHLFVPEPALLFAVVEADVPPPVKNLALRGPVEGADHVEEGRLSRPGGPHDGDEFAFRSPRDRSPSARRPWRRPCGSSSSVPARKQGTHSYRSVSTGSILDALYEG